MVRDELHGRDGLDGCDARDGDSTKYVPHGGWNFASTPTDRENMAESFQNFQLNSTQASGAKKRIRENP